MAATIKVFIDNSKLEYDRGQFDGWCVYLMRPTIARYAPRDTEYFNFLKVLGVKYGSHRVYDDFVIIYSLTSKKIEQGVLERITKIANTYDGDNITIDIWFTVVYAGMVAEENKVNTKLGKRIKRLGMHQVLMQNYQPAIAANFSRGKPWRELHKIMVDLGF